jgi:predicted transcriptional regulator
MDRKWEGMVTDPVERKVFEALADPAWDFRTIEGLMKATKLSQSEVEKIIAKYQGLVRRSPMRDKKGRRLYTLTTKRRGFGEVFNLIRVSASKSTR